MKDVELGTLGINTFYEKHNIHTTTLYAHIVAVSTRENGTIEQGEGEEPVTGGAVQVFTADGEPLIIAGITYGEAKTLHDDIIAKLEKWHRPVAQPPQQSHYGPTIWPLPHADLLEITGNPIRKENDNG